MQRLGIDTMLVCSNVATATVDDDEVSAGQLRRLGELAAEHGVRIAYEALAWGTYVDDYRRSWRIVELADHDAVGVCLDSFHILSRGHDPAAIEEIPGSKIFYLQLADAPDLTMDVLSWSRHHRLFPGEGAFDLGAFVGHVLRAGYAGPLSLEVFNDVFRQTDVDADRAAGAAVPDLARGPGRPPGHVDVASAAAGRLPEVAQPVGFDFVEVRGRGHRRGRRPAGPARLHVPRPAPQQGRAAVDRGPGPGGLQRAARAGPVADAGRRGVRGGGRRPCPRPGRARSRRRPSTAAPSPTEQELPAFRAPDGTEVFLGPVAADGDAAWVPEFEGGHEPAAARC